WTTWASPSTQNKGLSLNPILTFLISGPILYTKEWSATRTRSAHRYGRKWWPKLPLCRQWCLKYEAAKRAPVRVTPTKTKNREVVWRYMVRRKVFETEDGRIFRVPDDVIIEASL
ncbi:unnamed protein product, partial [Ectocarpus sp. 12 AP-2014]